MVWPFFGDVCVAKHIVTIYGWPIVPVSTIVYVTCTHTHAKGKQILLDNASKEHAIQVDPSASMEYNWKAKIIC